MLSAERKLEIAKIINENGKIKTSELSKRFNVSEMTVLRDLASLEEEGVLKRVYGGALAFNDSSNEISSVFRSKINLKQKDSIASKALSLISEGSSIYLDSSTTSLSLAKLVGSKKNITLVTNGLDIINTAKGNGKIKIICPGGELNDVNMSFYGPSAEKFIEDINVNIAFISAAGISLKSGITEQNPQNIAIKKIMVKNSDISVLLIDSSKFGKITLNKVCLLQDIDTIITDKEPAPQYVELFKNNDIKLLYCS